AVCAPDTTKTVSTQVKYPSTAKVAADLKKLLDRPKVPFNAKFKVTRTDSAVIERGYFYSEKNEKVPVLIYKPVAKDGAFPAVIILHGTGGTKDNADIKDLLYRLTKRGMMGVAIDARFHGERVQGGAHGSKEYQQAIIRAWKNKDKNHQTHPFYFDTVYDLWRLTDYLVTRPDVQAKRIGMAGISMGGIETWLAASVDKRIKVAVPDIAVQSLKWSLDNGRWQGRAGTIKDAHLQAAKDLGDTAINKRNIDALWHKVIPGITGEFDCPSMLRLFAPRPLLILNTEKDPNNPLPGAKIAFESATAAYKAMNALPRLKIDVAPNQGHRATPEHMQMMINWFGEWL
ncbi:MAG TPA: acetylxylan esterase, partial [Mucilaginibacter sp.]|nr:acetylxylan esterase [Mucilaginibacter sp.]